MDACPQCGIIYAKYRPTASIAPLKTLPQHEEELPSWPNRLLSPWVYVPERVSIEVLIGRALVWLAFALWSIYFFRAGIDWEKLAARFYTILIYPSTNSAMCFSARLVKP